MPDADKLLDASEVRAFLFDLAFVREFSISVASLAPGSVTIELPFDERFSGPPNLFPASVVGTAGDVAAAASCLTLMPKGWALATLDFTVKMTGIARGEKLLARGRVLQDGRTNSIGAADVYGVLDGTEVLCGTVLATTRNFKIKALPFG
ncbi:MAG TPA: PaaI family thioesterase [Candidatus Solibacter sp.]|nr:PaaI family thioesterase [Candidatus Solibacter sp.]